MSETTLSAEVEAALNKCHPSRWLLGSVKEAVAAHDFLRTALEHASRIEAMANEFLAGDELRETHGISSRYVVSKNALRDALNDREDG
jgi:hypothetical protein